MEVLNIKKGKWTDINEPKKLTVEDVSVATKELGYILRFRLVTC